MNRRRFLGASAAGTATLLSGCLGVMDGGSSLQPVTNWLVPRPTGESDSNTDEIRVASPSRKLEIDDDVSEDLEEIAGEETSYVWGDVDPSAVDLDILASSTDNGSYTISTGSFDTSEARSTLEDMSQTEASTYEGFDVYPDMTIESGPTTAEATFGVGDSVVLGVWNYPGESTDLLHRIVDAGTEASGRLVDQHDELATAASRMDLGYSAYLYGVGEIERPAPYRGAFAGMRTYGQTYTLNGGSVDVHEVFVFESADSAKSASLDTYLSEKRSQERDSSLSHSVDGNVIEVTESMPPSAADWG